MCQGYVTMVLVYLHKIMKKRRNVLCLVGTYRHNKSAELFPGRTNKKKKYKYKNKNMFSCNAAYTVLNALPKNGKYVKMDIKNVQYRNNTHMIVIKKLGYVWLNNADTLPEKFILYLRKDRKDVTAKIEPLSDRWIQHTIQEEISKEAAKDEIKYLKKF